MEVVWRQKIRKTNQETSQMSRNGLHVLIGEKKKQGITKNRQCIFFCLSDNFYVILSEKMRKYRDIAPENDPCRVLTTLYIDFSDAQGQITSESVVGSGRNLNSSKLSCISWLPVRMKIRSKMKALEC